MSNVLRLLGFVWAAPITVLGLAYALLFNMLGWYKWVGVSDNALVWKVNPTAPGWLLGWWKPWGGHTIGNVVVINFCMSADHEAQVLVHENQHVLQCMRLGVFQPIMYGLCMLAIKVGCKNSDIYFDCVFEIDARRGAGQLIDVVGEMKKQAPKTS